MVATWNVAINTVMNWSCAVYPFYSLRHINFFILYILFKHKWNKRVHTYMFDIEKSKRKRVKDQQMIVKMINQMLPFYDFSMRDSILSNMFVVCNNLESFQFLFMVDNNFLITLLNLLLLWHTYYRHHHHHPPLKLIFFEQRKLAYSTNFKFLISIKFLLKGDKNSV